MLMLAAVSIRVVKVKVQEDIEGRYEELRYR
jgi:hypothetical protein